MIDFTYIAQLLRAHLAAHPPIVVGKDGHLQLHPESMIARDALVKVESDLAYQCIYYLYDHLTAHEQWRKAAALLAYCLPHAVLDRYEIRSMIADAAAMAESVATPDVELAHYLKAHFTHELPDFMAGVDKITPRAAYWAQVVKLREARASLEWACGSGVHVMQAAQLFPDVQWYGRDASVAQVDACRKQGIKFGVPPGHFFVDLEASFRVPVVAVLDTIEHTVHPGPMLDAVEKYVAPGGVVVVSVPNGPWSLHTSSIPGVNNPPGNHVNVQHAREFIPYLESRGTILDARVLPGPFAAAEGNSTLAVTYKVKP